MEEEKQGAKTRNKPKNTEKNERWIITKLQKGKINKFEFRNNTTVNGNI